MYEAFEPFLAACADIVLSKDVASITRVIQRFIIHQKSPFEAFCITKNRYEDRKMLYRFAMKDLQTCGFMIALQKVKDVSELDEIEKNLDNTYLFPDSFGRRGGHMEFCQIIDEINLPASAKDRLGAFVKILLEKYASDSGVSYTKKSAGNWVFEAKTKVYSNVRRDTFLDAAGSYPQGFNPPGAPFYWATKTGEAYLHALTFLTIKSDLAKCEILFENHTVRHNLGSYKYHLQSIAAEYKSEVIIDRMSELQSEIAAQAAEQAKEESSMDMPDDFVVSTGLKCSMP